MTFYLSKEPVTIPTKTTNGIYVLVFKTNIQFKKDLKVIEQCLQGLGTVVDWSIDREDIDKVLRVESKRDNANEIINGIKHAGFFCEEL